MYKKLRVKTVPRTASFPHFLGIFSTFNSLFNVTKVAHFGRIDVYTLNLQLDESSNGHIKTGPKRWN
jgi:hypothetical protein